MIRCFFRGSYLYRSVQLAISLTAAGPKSKAGKQVLCAALWLEKVLLIAAMKQTALGLSAADPGVLEDYWLLGSVYSTRDVVGA